MRLKSISLSGFKSFVDPTEIELPHDISVFVGPNGCGKSNVVDAVRLVIGESRATQIRGDSLSDVIFEGTDSRPPTVQASVELLFDNSDKGLAGPYAKYSEVSLRREIYKDMRSKFLLNGRVCRRKDIQDLFLGSGFGARGYAIVEQGFVEHLVDARPEEVREHIEEVAGISKYRDRRRDTEKRIRITNENLERVRDNSAELARHIARLKRQAREAQRYTELKDRERLAQARLLAFQIRSLDSVISEQDALVQESQLELQRQQTELQSTRTAIDGLREEEVQINELFNKVQGEAFEARSRSSRIEDEISSRRSRIGELEGEADLLSRRKDELETELAEDKQAIEEIDLEHEHVEKSLHAARERATAASTRVGEAQENLNHWQERWNQLLQEIGELERDKQFAQARLTNIASTLEDLKLRKQRSQNDADLQVDIERVNLIRQELSEAELHRDSMQESLQALEEEATQIENQHNIDQLAHNESKELLQSTRDQLTANNAFLESALGRGSTSTSDDWLTSHGLAERPRLVEKVKVSSKWQKAVELVLGDNIKAIPVPDLTAIASRLNEEIDGSFTLLESAASSSSIPQHSLLNHILEGRELVEAMCRSIRACESVEEALKVRTTLAEHESAITQSGVWIGRHWIRVAGSGIKRQGVMEIRESIAGLESRLADLESDYSKMQDDLNERHERSVQLRVESRKLQTALNEQSSKCASLQLDLQREQMRTAESEERRERAFVDLERIGGQEDELALDSEKQSKIYDHSSKEVELLEAERELLEGQRERNAKDLESVLLEAQNAGEEFRELDVKFNTMTSSRSSLERSCIRRESDISELNRQVERLRSSCVDLNKEVEKFSQEREVALQAFTQTEQRLRETQSTRDTISFSIREKSNAAVLQERTAQDSQHELESHRERQIQLNAERRHLLDGIVSTQCTFEEASNSLTELDNEETLERARTRISNRIERLGAVNLAAVEDLAVLSEEHDLVVRQIEDLETSQTTLLEAIQKIDRETLSMFEETLEQANDKLQSVFSKLFDGGSARLVLTEQDPLTSGISIHAQPPGKRNKSVNQLSGGEKTLTAIAFIFAMFELNPSPVCVLDEVDAALDDSNVARFLSLIREMSQEVQFLLISHNRATMQVAESLIGVTMQEAGVSRLVSVDLETAFEAAA